MRIAQRLQYVGIGKCGVATGSNQQHFRRVADDGIEITALNVSQFLRIPRSGDFIFMQGETCRQTLITKQYIIIIIAAKK